MQISKTNKFLSDWGFHAVLVAVTLPILGLAYLAWTVLPAPSTSPTSPLPIEAPRTRALDVIAAFHSAGLEAEIVTPVSKDERDGLSTFMLVDSRIFRISNNDKEMGMVLSFQNRDELKQMQKYLLGLNGSFPRYRSWVFVKDNILLQINHDVSEQTARAYADVLETLEPY